MVLGNALIDDPFDYGWFFNLDQLLDHHFHLDHFGHFHYPFDDFLDQFGHFHYFLVHCGYLDYLLDQYFDVFNDVNRHVNDFFDLLNFDDLDYFLDYSFDGNDLGYFSNAFNYFFDYLLNLDYFRNYTKHL